MVIGGYLRQNSRRPLIQQFIYVDSLSTSERRIADVI